MSQQRAVVPFQKAENKNFAFKGVWKTGTSPNDEPYEAYTATSHTYHPYADETQDEILQEIRRNAPNLLPYPNSKEPYLKSARGGVGDHYFVGERLDIKKPANYGKSYEELKGIELGLMGEIKNSLKDVADKFLQVAEVCALKSNYKPHAHWDLERNAKGALEASRVIRDMTNPTIQDKITHSEKTMQILQIIGDDQNAESCKEYIEKLKGH